jgi:hypothetical protein
MPKIKLEFDMNEELTDAELAINASKYQSVLQELDEKMRGYLKHGDVPENIKTPMQMCDHLREYLLNEINDHSLTLM